MFRHGRDTISAWTRSTETDAEVNEALIELLRQELTLEESVLNNRHLQATYENLGIARGALIQAGLLENPVFGGEWWDFDEGTSFEGLLSQNILSAITIPMRKQLRGNQYEATKLQVTTQVIHLIGSVKRTYYLYQANKQMVVPFHRRPQLLHCLMHSISVQKSRICSFSLIGKGSSVSTKRIEIAIATLLILILAGCSTGSDSSASISAPPRPYLPPAKSIESDSPKALPELTETSNLSDYLRYAALNNPGLEAAFYRWRAAIEEIPQVTSLPDPRLTYQYFIEEVETRVGPQQQSVGISQVFPWFGKLRLQGDVATQRAEIQRQRYEQVKYQLFYRVQDAYSEYYYLGQAIQILQENIELIKHLEEVSRSQYRTAGAASADVIKAQVELGTLEDRLRSLMELKGPAQARLNAALNRPVDAPLPWPKQLDVEELELSDEELIRLAMEANPEIQAYNHEVLQGLKQIELAQKQYYPDITIGLNYIDTGDSPMRPAPSDSGKDPVMAMISLNIPIWTSKYNAAVRQARADYYAARKSREETINSVVMDLKQALYELHDAKRKINLYRETLLPKAIETYRVTEADYLTGKATFLDIIDAQRVLLDFQLSLQRALANYQKSLARVEMLVGEPLRVKANN